MRCKRRNHLPGFKAKVALAAIKGDKMLVELSEQFEVHQNQITDWNKQLLEQAFPTGIMCCSGTVFQQQKQAFHHFKNILKR